MFKLMNEKSNYSHVMNELNSLNGLNCDEPK